MKLFDKAYLKLTGWYVLIIMAISLFFSVWVYNLARAELQFGLGKGVPVQTSVLDLATSPDNFSLVIDERLKDSHNRLIVRLASLNVVVLVVAAAASHLLARHTMRPIEEAVEAQHRFTADASHELRTPLAAMKAEIEVGLRDKKLSKQEAVELLQSNLEEIDHLGSLADGLLALTRPDALTAGIPVALEEITSKVAKRMQPLAETKHIKLWRQLQPVMVRANEADLDKLIGILLDNAIKYSPDKTTITLSTHRKDNYAYVTVADQGIGIKASELPHIFDRFYRADSSRSKSNALGHGLGLSIAQQLAENLGGTIQATSTPGQGSTFTLKLAVA